MPETLKPYTTIVDFVTGKEMPNIGAEENRQAVARYLVEEKGYQKSDIAIDVDIEMTIAGEVYRSQIDLVISVDEGWYGCDAGAAAGSGKLWRPRVCWTQTTRSPLRWFQTAKRPSSWIQFPAKGSGKEWPRFLQKSRQLKA